MKKLARHALAATLATGLFALTACAAPQSAPPLEAAKLDAPLSRYVDDAQKFSALFPGTPKHIIEPQVDRPDRHKYESTYGSRAYLVSVSTLRRVNNASDEDTLQAARDIFTKDSAKLLLDQRLLVSGRPARDIRVETNDRSIYYVRLIVDGNTFYQAISVGNQPSEAAAYFAKSLTLLP